MGFTLNLGSLTLGRGISPCSLPFKRTSLTNSQSGPNTVYFSTFISEDLKSAVCPNKCYTDVVRITEKGKELTFKFMKDDCCNCPLKNSCFTENDIKKGLKSRRLKVSIRHDAILRDLNRNETEEFNNAYNKRYKVERRFATLVRNHGLRRCRYLRLKGAKTHITLANIACNIIRMVTLIFNNHQPSFAISKIE